MRIGDHLFFAPNIKFSEVNFSDDVIGNQYKARIDGYYLCPAKLLAENKYAFASGLLTLCCIDALAKQRFPQIRKDGERYQKWVQQELKSFEDESSAKRLYELFRNGLVHNARLTKGMEFSFEQRNTLEKIGTVLTINPSLILQEVMDALENYLTLINSNDKVRQYLVDSLKTEFLFELTH